MTNFSQGHPQTTANTMKPIMHSVADSTASPRSTILMYEVEKMACPIKVALSNHEASTAKCVRVMITPSNSIYTDTWARITIDIIDTGFAALSPLFSVIWNIHCQYNNFNMPNNCLGHCLLWGGVTK